MSQWDAHATDNVKPSRDASSQGPSKKGSGSAWQGLTFVSPLAQILQEIERLNKL